LLVERRSKYQALHIDYIFMIQLRMIRLFSLATLTVLGILIPQKALALPAPDLKARLLSDIAFQYAKLGDSQQAIAISQQALKAAAAMQPCFKANSLARVAGSYLLVGQETESKHWVEEAIKTARTQAATGCSGSATSPTESLMYRAGEFADEGQFELAIALGSGMGDPLTLSEIATDLLAVGQSQQADELLKEAIAQAQKIDDAYYQTQTLNIMGTKLVLAGHTEPAKAILEQALVSAATLNTKDPKTAALQGNSLLRTARQFTELGANDRAIAVVDQTLPKIRDLPIAPFPHDKVFQFVGAALLYHQVGLKDKAVLTLAEGHQVAKAIAPDNARRGRADADALGRVAIGYAKIGDFKRAMQIVQEIQPASERQGALGDIAIVHAEAGNLEVAIKLAQSNPNRNGAMIGIVRHYLQQKQPDQAWQVVQTHQVKGILSEVAVGYLDAGQPEQALQLVQTGKLEGFMPDIVQGYTRSGQPQRAMQLAQSEGIAWLLPSVVQGFAQQRQFDAALQTAQSIADPVHRAQALITIAHAYAEPQAEAQGTIRGFVMRLQDWVVGTFGTSDRERAIEVLAQALQATQSISSTR
jgi:tetratricopeptide (TPR) repeat protein